jgi:hypothetical protein
MCGAADRLAERLASRKLRFSRRLRVAETRTSPGLLFGGITAVSRTANRPEIVPEPVVLSHPDVMGSKLQTRP